MSNETSFQRPEFFGRRSVVESHKRRPHRINNRIAEREIFLLRSADGVFLAEIADADGMDPVLSQYICIAASPPLSKPDTIGIKNSFAGA